MKNLKSISILAILFFMASCVSTLKFPVSNLVPAADIVAKKKSDKNGNYKLTVTAKNLAAAERLDPPKSNYVVWVLSESDETRCIGRLVNNNAKTESVEALVPFNFKTVFITAEDQDGVTLPSGYEIARADFKK